MEGAGPHDVQLQGPACYKAENQFRGRENTMQQKRQKLATDCKLPKYRKSKSNFLFSLFKLFIMYHRSKI